MRRNKVFWFCQSQPLAVAQVNTHSAFRDMKTKASPQNNKQKRKGGWGGEGEECCYQCMRGGGNNNRKKHYKQTKVRYHFSFDYGLCFVGGFLMMYQFYLPEWQGRLHLKGFNLQVSSCIFENFYLLAPSSAPRNSAQFYIVLTRMFSSLFPFPQ